MKKIIMALLAMIIVFSFAACASNSDKENEMNSQAMGEDDIKSKLVACADWAESTLWVNGFGIIDAYVAAGAGANSEVVDIQSLGKNLESAMKEMETYDEFFDALEGTQYDLVKQYWGALSAKAKELYEFYLEEPLAEGDEEYALDTFSLSYCVTKFKAEVDASLNP